MRRHSGCHLPNPRNGHLLLAAVYFPFIIPFNDDLPLKLEEGCEELEEIRLKMSTSRLVCPFMARHCLVALLAVARSRANAENSSVHIFPEDPPLKLAEG